MFEWRTDASERCPKGLSMICGFALCRLLIVMCITLACVWIVARSFHRHYDTELQDQVGVAQTLTLLHRVGDATVEAYRLSKSLPPENLDAYVAWIEEYAEKPEPIRGQESFCRDAWGELLRRVHESPRRFYVASCGPNRRWDAGRGDDILGSLLDLEIMSPRKQVDGDERK